MEWVVQRETIFDKDVHRVPLFPQYHRNTDTATKHQHFQLSPADSDRGSRLAFALVSSFLFVSNTLRGFKKSSLIQARGLHAAAEVQQRGGRGATGVPGLNQPQDQPDILPQRHR
jgi:hypothetical protein